MTSPPARAASIVVLAAAAFVVVPGAAAQETEAADSADSGAGATASDADTTVARAPAVLMGRVLAADSTPLGDAVVVLPEMGIGTRTDGSGDYAFGSLPAGRTVIEVRWDDRRSVSSEIDLAPDSLNRVDLRLQPEPVELPGIAVTVERPIPRGKMAGFHLRMERGRGAYVTREEIEAISANRMSDVFRRVSGVRLVRHRRRPGLVRLRMARAQPTFTGEGAECRPLYFLDGKRFDMDESDGVDQIFDPDEVAGVEVYRGPAEVPPLFNAPGSRCGVVVIWTREE